VPFLWYAAIAKRGDELREVVLLKSSSDLREEPPYHWRSATEGIRGLVDSSRKRDKGNHQNESLGKRVSIEIL
jgi:hypothetical protein